MSQRIAPRSRKNISLELGTRERWLTTCSTLTRMPITASFLNKWRAKKLEAISTYHSHPTPWTKSQTIWSITSPTDTPTDTLFRLSILTSTMGRLQSNTTASSHHRSPQCNQGTNLRCFRLQPLETCQTRKLLESISRVSRDNSSSRRMLLKGL
jgi:hypothetical protein